MPKTKYSATRADATAAGALSSGLTASPNRTTRAKLGIIAVAAAAALAVGLPGTLGGNAASANVIFTLGNNPQPNEENILFQAPQTGLTVTGATNMTNVPVFFSTLTGQQLLQNSQGQADILQNVPMPAQNSALTSMDINLTAPNFTAGAGVPSPVLGFTDFIMNPLNGSGTATVTAFDNFGQTFTYPLGNGQNYLTLTTANGEVITDVQIKVAGGSFIEFKQPRISGVCRIGAGNCNPVPPIPEPASLGLLGTALAGLGIFMQRRRRKI